MKRILLFVATNLAVMITLSIVLSLLGVGGYITPDGLDYSALMVFCLVWGMGGAFISLQMSRFMAKMAMGVQLVNGRSGQRRARLAVSAPSSSSPRKASLPMPEVGIYDSPEVNAFATGPSKKPQPRRGVDRPAALDAPRGSRGRARPRGRAHPERRHGHDDADPGRRERLRDVLRPHHRQHRPADGRRADLAPGVLRGRRSCSTSCSASSA